MSREGRTEIANAFGRKLDRLAQYETTFEELAVDPFEVFVEDSLSPTGSSEKTVGAYRKMWEQWTEYMELKNRHPACPAEHHVLGWIEWMQSDVGNAKRTVKQKLLRLGRVYRYWQTDGAFPHPSDFDPIKQARQKTELSPKDPKDPPKLELEEVRNRVKDTKSVRMKTIVVAQLKLGMRAGEIANIKLRDINLPHEEVRDYYPEIGTSRYVEDRESAIYVPSRNERKGNKSKKPRVLPLDDEMRRLFLRYLLIRPVNKEGWLFLTEKTHSKMQPQDVNREWSKSGFGDISETRDFRSVTSHFGRHYFTTFWRVQEDLNRELVQYMRGDKVGTKASRDGIDHYLHAYYDDIEKVYQDRIYKLL